MTPRVASSLVALSDFCGALSIHPSLKNKLGIVLSDWGSTMSVAELEKSSLNALLAEPALQLKAYSHLLRSYMFDPSTFNSELVGRLLLSTLPHFSESQCSACLNLIPERFQERPEIKVVAELDDLLERSNFSAFWPAYHEAKKGFHSEVPEFESRMRQSILAFLSMTFVTIDIAIATSMLGLSGPAEVVKLANAVATVNSNQLVFKSNDFNRPKPPPEPRDLSSANIAALIRCA